MEMRSIERERRPMVGREDATKPKRSSSNPLLRTGGAGAAVAAAETEAAEWLRWCCRRSSAVQTTVDSDPCLGTAKN